MAQVSEGKGVRIYEDTTEISVVQDGPVACLRVAPTRDRAMPILVRLPEGLERFVTRGLTATEEEMLATVKGLQKQVAELNGLTKTLSRANETLEAQLRAEKERRLNAEEEMLKRGQAIDALKARLKNLRNAVLLALDPKDPKNLWEIVHGALRRALPAAGYLLRSECSWFSWARWFGGQHILPDTFCCSRMALPHEDFSARAEVYEAIRAALAADLAPALQAAAETDVTPPGNGI